MLGRVARAQIGGEVVWEGARCREEGLTFPLVSCEPLQVAGEMSLPRLALVQE